MDRERIGGIDLSQPKFDYDFNLLLGPVTQETKELQESNSLSSHITKEISLNSNDLNCLHQDQASYVAENATFHYTPARPSACSPIRTVGITDGGLRNMRSLVYCSQNERPRVHRGRKLKTKKNIL